MRSERCAVVINADDFGQTESCTRAIWEAFRKGLITDTTMVANGEAMDLALELLDRDPRFRDRIGVHFILTEGCPLTAPIRNNPKFVTDGRFNSYFKEKSNYFHPLTGQDRKDLYRELTAQAALLKSKGVELNHADSHHHVHFNWMLLPIVLRVCEKQEIGRVRHHKDVFSGLHLKGRIYAALFDLRLELSGFSGPRHFEALRNYRQLPNGVSELMVHPDYDGAGVLIDRTGRENGVPVGVPLEPLVEALKLEAGQQIGYRSV